MKLKRIRLNGAQDTPFAKLIFERVAATRELQEKNTMQALKLTAAAYLEAAMKIADTTPEKLAVLRKKLETPDSVGATEVSGCLRRMIAAVRSVNFPGPPSEARRWSYCMTATALAELAALRSSIFELAALAVLIATSEHPDDFGTNESLADHEKHLVALRLRIEELDRAIATAYTADDILIGKPDDKGNSRVTFKLSDGAVTVGPEESAGERLANWMVSQQAT